MTDLGDPEHAQLQAKQAPGLQTLLLGYFCNIYNWSQL